VKGNYEPGMKIKYDPTAKRVVVAFRGRITVLPESYDTELEGISAAEFHCRQRGWNPSEQGPTTRKTLTSLF
jgi:hypothetical protein